MYPSLSFAIFLYDLTFGMSIKDLSDTFGLYLDKDLPESDESHCLCYCDRPINVADCFTSAMVTVYVSSDTVAASLEASLASLSASSFPLMLACPGVQDI